jgi:putative spermidine/putrescine transport system ATP-binding protein
VSAAPEPPPEIRLVDVTKQFHEVVAVDDVSLDVNPGEFLTLLGPSGCGKTTTLRMIGGFDLPTRGRIELRGRDVTSEPPDKRPVNMVFQSYALFPHLDVAGNIAFGLKRRGVAGDEIKRRTAAILEKVHLAGYEKRRTNELSGGQQQRVALARALVNRPKVLLLDEPLGALDLKLRQEMQIELKEIQRQVGLTFIYVTHDQDEALTMSDRLAVFNRGKVEQVGSPADVYERPATGFVAGFVGVSNVLEGEVARRVTGDPAAFTIRPEKIEMTEIGATVGGDDCTATGSVREVVYLGAVTRYIVALDGGGELVVMQQNLSTSSMEALQVKGKAVRLTWHRRHNRPVEAPSGAEVPNGLGGGHR